MSSGIISVRYAKALISYANELGVAESLYKEMLKLSDMLKNIPNWRAVVLNPTINKDLKIKFIESLLLNNDKSVSSTMSKFLKLVFSAGRGELLLFMTENYIKMYRDMNNILKTWLITAHPVGSNIKERVSKLVYNVCNGTVEWSEKIDESIQGGFILRVDGFMFDASVKTTLERVKKEIVEKNKRKI